MLAKATITGITVTRLWICPPLSLPRKAAINIADTIAVGTDFFNIPRKKENSAKEEKAKASIPISSRLCRITVTFNVTLKRPKILPNTHNTAFTKIFDRKIIIKVSDTITNSFVKIRFFLFIGYINSTDIVLFLYSSITNLETRTEANTRNTSFTSWSVIEKI